MDFNTKCCHLFILFVIPFFSLCIFIRYRAIVAMKINIKKKISNRKCSVECLLPIKCCLLICSRSYILLLLFLISRLCRKYVSRTLQGNPCEKMAK